MPPPSSKPPPLPLAPDRAAISNQISLLLSSRASLLGTLNPAPSPSAARTCPRRHHVVSPDDVEQLFAGPRPNEGVGYVPDGSAASREDGMLRGRLLGKRHKSGKASAAGSRFAVESESDEEPGRSGLGKRKRPRRGAGGEEQGDRGGDGDVGGDAETSVVDADGVAMGEGVAMAGHSDGGSGDDAQGKKQKKKKKRQKQRQKQKQKQKHENA
ncbi:hypothetical protein Trco_006617 [Trichoderma cornu-damae]|uniref:Uncharacterized protein n=1 Tax=Trichoderma cornu-damae TaxID=654480 RepID=A0A9P8QFF6_9HYPO|nr:hypothetical protein Trco_006617 [Trichoderma cornu-damae]